ncbi:maleylpyruvate isomerase N-terminal domain-containing protein [Brachybacterium vulturis]|uniref:maleylpyruvate isomerase N-terminal domain-containing protein n=1 Tax=Brachybacterium vulturis TaxID=2017484 RepID=UPI0037356528
MDIDAITTIRHEAERLATALTLVDPGQRVPTCPEWTADDLLWHLTEVHEFWAEILATGATTEDEVRAIRAARAARPGEREALLQRRATATGALLAQLEARADEEPAWFWFAEQQGVGITRRMQTHEATIHRVDAELTAGHSVSAIDSRIAAAGLDHVLEVMWPAAYEWIPDWAVLTPVAAVEVRPQGGSARWLGISRWTGTRPRDGQEFDVPVGRLLDGPPAEELPRAGVGGSARALCLWAWGREQALEHLADGAQSVRIQGDPEAIAALEALIAEGHD